jgi:hypothetical protein
MEGCFRVKFGLLGEWWCAPANMSEADCLKAIVPETLVAATPEMIRERLYGGFGCAEPSRRHIYHDTGAYTYLGENSHLDEAERRAQWGKLIEENGEPGAGPFTAAGPSS